MKVAMRKDFPQLDSLCIDSLGKGKAAAHPPLIREIISKKYRSTISAKSISYQIESQEKNSPPAWKFSFSNKSIQIISEKSGNSEPFNININQELNHATVLGIMKERNKVALPCLIHLPDMGTFRVTSNVSGLELLTDARRTNSEVKGNPEHHFVSISFPPASVEYPQIIYQLEIVSIYPDVTAIKNDPVYDGFRRNFINIFQVNPRLRVLANNSSSDSCAFTLYMSAQLAQYTPPLADGLKAMDLVKMTLDRYISGMKAYGLVGYTDNYEEADTVSWKSKYDSLDSHPSLLMAACYYINSANDTKWLNENISSLIEWADITVKNDIDEDGLIEYPLSGNYGTWDGVRRPANWWDTVGFGHKDAYSNALAYRALNLFGEILRNTNMPESQKYTDHAAKLKSAYYSTFYNPESGVLAGWKSKDGQLHDYYFTFVNSIAISYGLLNEEQGNRVMDKLLSKMESVGFTDFSLGLPGNLIPVKKGDYTASDHRWGGPSLEDGTDAFQIYENGGATACYTYFMVDALQKLKRNPDSRKILYPILKSISDGNFSGSCVNGMSKDWKTWKGECWGYEGFLCDGYMVLLSCLGEDERLT
ncbi:MAG: hypothetical protein NTZ69_16795 [Bacteroidia bacterium]|nr:hypothetical protein [Bacteroidia bacterium]